MMLSGGSCSPKGIYSLAPAIKHSGKAKIIGTENRSVVGLGWGKRMGCESAWGHLRQQCSSVS